MDGTLDYSRARQPDQVGLVERDGVRVRFEVHGEGDLTVFLLPTWSINHSRAWKAQVHFLARHLRVLTMDGRGNGGSDRPTDPAAYAVSQFAGDALAVMDATATERATLVAHSRGAAWALMLAAQQPHRVSSLVFVSPVLPLAPGHPWRRAAMESFGEPRASYEGWSKYNRHHWVRDYRDFLEFFFSEVFSEKHSTKQREDGVRWGLEATAETVVATELAGLLSPELAAALSARVRCPVLVAHGSDDRVVPHEVGATLARATAGRLVTFEGSGHAPHARDPVTLNALLRDVALGSPTPPRVRRRALRRPRRALYVSSPIGLGHAHRDLAIARELRRLHPDLEIEWLAQSPVTRVLLESGETVHPASRQLAGEAAHVDAEASEHDLHVFQAWRRMDEILVANFMVFLDLVRERDYDLWVGDEAWELDYYLHENPELKTAAYAWLTDFVGWLPMPDGGRAEAALTADYNAEMVEQVERFPRVRDRSIFIGERMDVVPGRFGPGLPNIRRWVSQRYAFSGYVLGFDPEALDREALRDEFGYAPGEKVCLVSVGGSGVGRALLERAIAAFPAARRRVPELRMIAVAGPRLDPASLPRQPGVEVRGYVPQLRRHLAACDVALVQGGLATTMELTALRRPFLYFPLRHHFEQHYHVAHRLQRHRAGRRVSFEEATSDNLAAAIAEELGREPAYLPVRPGGAERAAALISELL
ncbi:MAG: alpha/beta fold hydrolase [Candidatus Dormibacteraeota bacterium]|nr:alpha/beta fold hydrolase [Candidatus Dormibacteraeota bacterium]